MSAPVDLTKIHPGDRVRLRNGKEALVSHGNRGGWIGYIRDDVNYESAKIETGWWRDTCEHPHDIVAIIHPTRAEIEEQRAELLAACKLAEDSLMRSASDMEVLKALGRSIAKAEGRA
jgi:hypothetical protein